MPPFALGRDAVSASPVASTGICNICRGSGDIVLPMIHPLLKYGLRNHFTRCSRPRLFCQAFLARRKRDVTRSSARGALVCVVPRSVGKMLQLPHGWVFFGLVFFSLQKTLVLLHTYCTYGLCFKHLFPKEIK